MLPTAVRFAIVADPALHAVAALVGSEHVTLGLDPITWFGILMAFAVLFHEIGGTALYAFRELWRGLRQSLDGDGRQ
jgi:hypothetical protein